MKLKIPKNSHRHIFKEVTQENHWSKDDIPHTIVTKQYKKCPKVITIVLGPDGKEL